MKKIVAALVAANTVDYITTVLGLKMGFVELNGLIAKLTPITFLLLKATVVGAMIALLYVLSNSENKIMKNLKKGVSAGVIFASIIIAGVGIHNLLLIVGAKI